jgi:fructose-bisphosphate aldolase class II
MTLKETIHKAYADRHALGGFNVYNLESAKAVVAAANTKEEPVFMMMSEKSLDYAGFDELVEIAKNLRSRSKIPIFLHLDHGGSLDIVKKCIKSGFDSVMFDGSKLPLDQNIQLSKDLRQTAHRNGVFFEAEIGHIGGAEDYVTSANFKTNPAEALMFYNEVKPDMLAVAIGNVHGYDVKNEELDFTLLAKLQDMIKAPLVLHGCSNRVKREYQVAIAQGIVKINIDTELRQAFVEGLHFGLRRRLKDPREILTLASKEVSKCVEEKIDYFSCSKLEC